MDKVRCMLNESGLPNNFWAEAASTACYLINRSPSSAIEFLVPEMKWSTVKPEYEHIRTFGCVVYVHVNQGKLNPRAKKRIFLGYPSGVKGYKKNASSKQAEQGLQNQVNSQNLDGNSQAELAGSRDSEGSIDSRPKNIHDIFQNQAQPDPHTNDQEVQGDEEAQSDGDNTQGLDGYVLSRDRIRRQIRVPPRFVNADFIAFALNVADLLELEEPTSYNEAKLSKDWPKWKKAMNEEIESLDKNCTWILVDRPIRKKVIGC
ncbi:uncharacterized protein [Primulina eburnea]|uniref:uncharacterized protein n=1 Tax=Primulina eburnea TaxID=1245227 RepID=UPI003C6C21E5